MPTTTTSDGVDINYHTVGVGPDIVLIHGLTDSSPTWGPITEMLAREARVTTLDLRGMGASGRSDDYSAFGMVRDVAAVVAAAAVTNPLVVGHSLGGIVATAYAAAAPVRGTVNVDQPLQLSSFQEGLVQVEPMLRDPNSFPAVIEMIFSGLNGDQLSQELKEDIAAHCRRSQAVVLGVWDQVFSTPVAELDALMADATATISAPYLSLQFVDNGPGYADWLRSLIPQAVVEEWPGLGHYGHRIHPERFVDRVTAFDHGD